MTSSNRTVHTISRWRWLQQMTLVAGAVLAWAATPRAADDQIAVIVSSENTLTAISRDALENIFKVRTQDFENGVAAMPVNLPTETALRERFDRVVLGLKPQDVERYWIDQRIRSGRRPPTRLPTEGGVLRYVESQKGGIGYVSVSAVRAKVRVIARIRGASFTGP